MPTHIKSVSIPLFDNLTPKAGLEETLRDKIWQSFQATNLVEVKRSGADAELLCTITSYQNIPDDYDVSGNVKSYKVVLTADIDFFDNKEKNSLYKGKATASGKYLIPSESEEAGLGIAVNALVEIVLNNTLRGF